MVRDRVRHRLRGPGLLPRSGPAYRGYRDGVRISCRNSTVGFRVFGHRFSWMILGAAREEMLENGWKPDMIMYSLLMNELFQGKKIRSDLRNRSRRRRFHMLGDE
jgi:hypothetical protein